VDVHWRLGANLKRLRTAKGWSQEQFAFEAGIHRTYISDLERGARNPTISVVQRLADCLGVGIGDLLS
jgi:transcriptional regulator with XRE-family HTH domain